MSDCKVLNCGNRADEQGYCEDCFVAVKRARLMNERADLRDKGYSPEQIDKMKPIKRDDELIDDDEEDEDEYD